MSGNYSYEVWKDCDDLQKVCSQLLDNANMDVKFTNCPFSIELAFFVIGSDIKVEFSCSGIEKFSIEKDSEDCPLYLVLEVHVSSPKKVRDKKMSDSEFWALDHEDYVWGIFVLPEADISIKSLSFDWSINQITEEEMKWLS